MFSLYLPNKTANTYLESARLTGSNNTNNIEILQKLTILEPFYGIRNILDICIRNKPFWTCKYCFLFSSIHNYNNLPITCYTFASQSSQTQVNRLLVVEEYCYVDGRPLGTVIRPATRHYYYLYHLKYKSLFQLLSFQLVIFYQ